MHVTAASPARLCEDELVVRGVYMFGRRIQGRNGGSGGCEWIRLLEQGWNGWFGGLGEHICNGNHEPYRRESMSWEPAKHVLSQRCCLGIVVVSSKAHTAAIEPSC